MGGASGASKLNPAMRGGGLPAIPDLTDKVIQMARERERRRLAGGGTKSSFLSGVLGDSSAPSSFVKQLMGK